MLSRDRLTGVTLHDYFHIHRLTSGKSYLMVSFSVCLCVRTIPKMLTDKFTRTIYMTNVVANSIKAIQSRIGGNGAKKFKTMLNHFKIHCLLYRLWLLTLWILRFCRAIDGVNHFVVFLSSSNTFSGYFLLDHSNSFSFNRIMRSKRLNSSNPIQTLHSEG